VFNATTAQSLTGAATVYALKNSGQAITLGSNTLTIGDKVATHQAGLIMNGGSISGGTLAFGSAEGTVYTSLAGGSISSAITTTGGVTTFGPGVLTLSGTSNYTGGTTVNGGTLKINGSIAGNVTLGIGATLAGSGAVAGSVAGGLISPGSSPGILKAGSTSPSVTINSTSNVTTVSTNYAFEFTQTGQPNYNSAASSGNDLLHLTSATAPFSGALTSSNEIDVYFNISTGVHANDSFFGGFYTDQNAAFDSSIQSATYKYFVQDAAGSTTFNGVSYSPYTANPVLVSTVSQSADFGSGPVNGYVTEVQVTPEPSTWFCLASGAGLIAAARPRRRFR
jgi:autotransporter-associated beta strand protein